MNRITIHGRLTREPEMRDAGPSASVCSFTVAVNRRFDREKSDFFDCQAWGKLGLFVERYFHKGSEILVSGEMQSRKYTNKEGSQRTSWSVNVDQIDFCGNANPSNQHKNQTSQASFKGAPKEEIDAGFSEISEIDDGTLPF